MRIHQLTGIDTPAEDAIIRVRNAETSATIPEGAPMCFVFNGTNDGVGVVLPATGGANLATTMFAGVAGTAIPAGTIGPAIVFGYTQSIRLVRATRAASTDAWGSTPAIATGNMLAIATQFNAFTFSATGGASAFLPAVMAGQSLASATTLVSSSAGTNDTRLADTTLIRGFVRAM
jgi:hypothetical protein